MKRAIKTWLSASVLALGVAVMLPARASVVIAGTRVVYNAKDSEVTVKLTNNGKQPALTQIWLDTGDPNAAPSSIDVPFTVTPPLARIDPGKGQTLRIIYSGEPQPLDRESVFWLNVLEVPPNASADEADSSRLQMAFRTRIKMFFRPEGLKGRADEAPAKLAWRIIQTGRDTAIEARNPTAYNVSFSSLELVGGGKSAKYDGGGMVGPGETRRYPLTGDVRPGADARLRYRAINDFGGTAEVEVALDGTTAK